MLFEEDSAFDNNLKKLLETLATDLDYVRLHTRLLVAAREWDTRGRDPSFLLQGTELQEAQQFLAESASKERRRCRCKASTSLPASTPPSNASGTNTRLICGHAAACNF